MALLRRVIRGSQMVMVTKQLPTKLPISIKFSMDYETRFFDDKHYSIQVTLMELQLFGSYSSIGRLIW